MGKKRKKERERKQRKPNIREKKRTTINMTDEILVSIFR